jgi:hypothetical protein
VDLLLGDDHGTSRVHDCKSPLTVFYSGGPSNCGIARSFANGRLRRTNPSVQVDVSPYRRSEKDSRRIKMWPGGFEPIKWFPGLTFCNARSFQIRLCSDLGCDPQCCPSAVLRVGRSSQVHYFRVTRRSPAIQNHTVEPCKPYLTGPRNPAASRELRAPLGEVVSTDHPATAVARAAVREQV